MKSTEYQVVYFNGDEETFYCMGVNACYAAATHYMNSKARDSRIRSIYDKENKTTYTDFELKFTTR